MILLQVKELKKYYGAEKIFEKVSFHIQAGEKIGLVGPNGAGKTTLLKCITGEEPVETGEITISNSIKIGYLEQIPQYSSEIVLFDTIMDVFADIFVLRNKMSDLEVAMGKAKDKELERIMERYSDVTNEYERVGGATCESTARKVLKGLGFSEGDLYRDVNSFSGGEKTKANLARLLVREPDLLLLDEPTNHLDLEAIEWLESYLRGYKGALLLISHDRYFLDQVTNKTLELEHGLLDVFPGNFTRYLKLKDEKILAQSRAYQKQQKKIKETEEYINKYRAGIKSKQARGRQSQLNRLERIDAPRGSSYIKLEGNTEQVKDTGKIVLRISDLSFGFEEKKLFQDLNLDVYKGDKVGLIGGNGVGKSTIIKLVMGQQKPKTGLVEFGARVKVGYYDQEHAGLDFNNRIIDELIYNFDLSETEARSKLGAFLFNDDDVFKPIKELSGGEKGRLSFLKMLLTEPNLLILDEPTNYLDIGSKDVIERFLEDFPGTVITVSHDRYFLDRIVNRTVELKDGSVTNYFGNYTYYKEKINQALKEQEELEKDNLKKTKKGNPKTEKPKINKAKTREKISSIEEEIEKLESRHTEISELLADSSTYQEDNLAKELVEEFKEIEQKISQSYEQWEELTELLASS